MSLGQKIYIVGGGPIGLLTGILLLRQGFDVTLFEEDFEIGYPQHCTGIISYNTLKKYPIDYNKLIIKKYYGVWLEIGDKHLGIFRSSTSKAVVIDRVGLERMLCRKFIDYGGEVKTSSKVNLDVLSRKNREALVIDAGGAKSLFRKGYRHVLPALQYVIRIEDISFEDDLAGILVDKTLNKDYFSWIAPFKNGFYKVGTASSSNVKKKLMTFIERHGSTFSINKKLAGLIVTGGPIKKFIVDNIISVGDAAGMVKITTGGGLLYGAVGAHDLTKAIVEGDLGNYRVRWMRKFRNELRLQELIRRIFLKSSNDDLIKILNVLSKNEVFNLLLYTGDMDFHASSLMKILYDRDLLRHLVNLMALKKYFSKIIGEYLTKGKL